MKKRIKLAFVLGISLWGSFPIWAETSEELIQIEGTFKPLVVSLSAPNNLTFQVDPNAVEAEQFISSEFELENTSMVPLNVQITRFEQVEGSETILTDVLPEAYENWTALTEEESMRDFALALKVVDPTEWVNETVLNLVWAKEVQESVNPVYVGTIPGASTESSSKARFVFEGRHGLRIVKSMNVAYRVGFLFDFGDTESLTLE